MNRMKAIRAYLKGYRDTSSGYPGDSKKDFVKQQLRGEVCVNCKRYRLSANTCELGLLVKKDEPDKDYCKLWESKEKLSSK